MQQADGRPNVTSRTGMEDVKHICSRSSSENDKQQDDTLPG